MKRAAPMTPLQREPAKSARTPLTPSATAREPWQQVYLVGTEWDIYDKAFEHPWDFSHFHEDLLPGGRLYEDGNTDPVYIFGVTEPQGLNIDPDHPEDVHVVLIPSIVAIRSRIPPPTMVALNSLQRDEEILPMRDLKMDWVPYVPLSAAGSTPGTQTPRAFFLKCYQRRSALRNMSPEAIIRYQYALPYVFIPRLHGKLHYDTFVSPIAEVRGKALPPIEFDWTCDDVDEVADEFCASQDLLTASDKPAIVQAINEAVSEKKGQLRAQRDALKEKMDALSDDEKEALDALTCVKYYPANVEERHHSTYINRYYNRAVEIR